MYLHRSMPVHLRLIPLKRNCSRRSSLIILSEVLWDLSKDMESEVTVWYAAGHVFGQRSSCIRVIYCEQSSGFMMLMHTAAFQ